MKSSLLLSILLMTSAAQAQLMCSNVFKPSVSVAEFEKLTGKSVYDFIFRYTYDIDAQVLAGTKTPTWRDFEVLNKLIVNLKSLKAELQDKPETAHMLESMAAEIKTMLLDRGNIQEMLQARSTIDKKNKAYQPTEREMKVAYQKLILELNRALPKELRVPMSRFKEDERMTALKTEAATFIKGTETKFENLMVLSPYKSYGEFERQLRASTDPEVQRAIQLVDKDQLQVVIRRPMSSRFWVPKVGFHNQFVTGSSKGFLDKDRRNQAERNLYTLDHSSDYDARDPEFKPKYGTLSVKSESGVKPDLNSSAHYGEDIYGFKTKNIQDRLTAFSTDSLDPGTWHYGKTSWDSSYIPWKYRLFLVPFMVEGLRENKLRSEDPVGLEEFGFLERRYYFETQILGPVRLEDVSTFTFTQLRSQPKGEFLRELIKHGIEIFDGTQGLGPQELRKWTPAPEDFNN